MDKLLTDTEYTKIHYMAFPKYENGPVNIQIPEFKMTWGGIPKKDNVSYNITEEQRATIKFPLDDTQPSCVKTMKMFDQIDNFMQQKRDMLFAALKEDKKN